MHNKKKSRRSAFLTPLILDLVGWQVALKIVKNRGSTRIVYHSINTPDACR
jgi:hypothetical protein